jgi:hypothetical protein
MSDPSLFDSQLARQAARNLYQLELISRTPVWTDWRRRQEFWHVQRMMARTPDETAAWLPALAFAVSCEKDADILAQFARWPLPEPLPPEARPWRDRLIQVWAQYPADTPWEKTIRLAALVRLDRRVERLPEWLREARRALDFLGDDRHLRLAALAGWRPRPGDAPPHGGKRGAAQAWGRFWEERYRTHGSEPDGLIAAAALLHLAEAGWLSSGPSPERLREEVRQQVQQWKTACHDRSLLPMVLGSVPAGSTIPEQQRQEIGAWLELTRKNVGWKKREAVWEMLAAWQREGLLERSGMGRLPAGRGRLPEPPLLLPALARALEWDDDVDVLLAMMRYVPEAAEVNAHPEAARAVVARWEALSRNGFWTIRKTAWVARWNLRRGGALTAEEQARLDADYMNAIRSEKERAVLLALVQIQPPGTFPLATWAGRLSDKGDGSRLAARLAIHGWLVEVMEGASGEWEGRPAGRPYEWRVASGRGDRPVARTSGEWRMVQNPLFAIPYSLFPTRQYGQFPELPLRLAITRRQVRQVLRRAGQEGAGNRPVAPFVNLPPEVLPDFRRLHEIETALAAGHLPPSPDAGMESQPAPHAVPARLPEFHPLTGPPGITGPTTGRTAGSESTTRHPSPETVRHE